MSGVERVRATDGTMIEYVPTIIGSGTMKDVYMTPDRQSVVALFRNPQDEQARDRINIISGRYREQIFGQEGGEYWERLFRWPQRVVEDGAGRIGVVVPVYEKQFFFEHGSIDADFLAIKGKEKEGKWFTSPTNRYKFLAPSERGDWRNYLQVAILLSRAVKRMHAAGLAHSDLSYKNVLIDPTNGRACLIDIDGLVVPGKFPPDVLGTPDFIAPEVVETQDLARSDTTKNLPCINTDRHALAVLVYMFLLLRHPLRGDKVHDVDDHLRDESLAMGSHAQFVEHPSDRSNRIKADRARPTDLPWLDTDRLPYSLTGPYLSELFERAFIEGVHAPEKRPSADEWERALVKSVDLIQPCVNSKCEQRWYVFASTRSPTCPFCGIPYLGMLPVINLYSRAGSGRYRNDEHRLMVYPEQSLFHWHIDRKVFPNERLSEDHKKRVGYFILHDGMWRLVNERMPDLIDVTDQNNTQPIGVGDSVVLKDNTQLLFSKSDGGRLGVVQLVDGRNR